MKKFSNPHPEYRNYDERVLHLRGEVNYLKKEEDEAKTNLLYKIVEDYMLRKGELRVDIPKYQLYQMLGGKEMTEQAVENLSEEGLSYAHARSSSYTFYFPVSKERSKRISYLNAEVRCAHNYRVNRARDAIFTIIRSRMKAKKAYKVMIPKVVIFSEVDYRLLEEVLLALFEEGISYVEKDGKFVFSIE